MDPNATLDELILSVLHGDFDDAQTHLNELHTWYDRGGFAPQDPRAPRAQ